MQDETNREDVDLNVPAEGSEAPEVMPAEGAAAEPMPETPEDEEETAA